MTERFFIKSTNHIIKDGTMAEVNDEAFKEPYIKTIVQLYEEKEMSLFKVAKWVAARKKKFIHSTIFFSIR